MSIPTKSLAVPRSPSMIQQVLRGSASLWKKSLLVDVSHTPVIFNLKLSSLDSFKLKFLFSLNYLNEGIVSYTSGIMMVISLAKILLHYDWDAELVQRQLVRSDGCWLVVVHQLASGLIFKLLSFYTCTIGQMNWQGTTTKHEGMRFVLKKKMERVNGDP